MAKPQKDNKKKKRPEKWMQKAAQRMEQKGTKGVFTKKAKTRGLTVQNFARKVMKNPNRYDDTTVKQANFAIQAAKASKKKSKKKK